MTNRRGDAFDELVERIARLRDPVDGCPWDRAQDHITLRPYMLEEAYEAIAAIDSGDPHALADELGGVLLQVVLHAQIASEKGEFAMEDVIDGLIAKLIRRNPHVFGSDSNDLSSILTRWNEIKAEEQSRKLPMPPLVEARKFVDERVIRARTPLHAEGMDAEEQAGMAILSAIAEAWKRGFEPEMALRKAMAASARTSGKPA